MDKEVLCRYLCGKATPEEEQQILDWLDSDPDKHVAELNALHFIDLAAQVHGDPAAFGKGKVRRIFRNMMRAAASVAALVGVWIASDLYSVNRLSKRFVVLEAPAGQRLQYRFEDGSKVWLNAGSTLEYPAVFARGQRRVKLSGEALFEVEHDPQRPFVVETFASEIEVLGTKFDVEADAEHNRFRAMLVEGSVEVRSRFGTRQTILMQPHDRVELIGGRLCKSRVEDFRELCWTEGILHIRKMPFDDLMRRLERAYNVEISIERETLPKIEVRSGKIRISEGIEYALHILQKVSDFTYTFDEENNRVVIK